jgi:hypothetical protein
MAGKRAVNTRVLAVLAALVVTSCAIFDKAEPRRKDCSNDDDCRVTVSVDCGTLSCRAKVDIDEIYLRGNNARWELDKQAQDAGFRFEPVYGIWFKTFAGQRDFECKPDGPMFRCKTKVHPPNGERYRYGVQILGPKPVALLDPWVVN